MYGIHTVEHPQLRAFIDAIDPQYLAALFGPEAKDRLLLGAQPLNFDYNQNLIGHFQDLLKAFSKVNTTFGRPE